MTDPMNFLDFDSFTKESNFAINTKRHYIARVKKSPKSHWCKKYLKDDTKPITWRKFHVKRMKMFCAYHNWYGLSTGSRSREQTARKCLKELGACTGQKHKCKWLVKKMVRWFENYGKELRSQGRLVAVSEGNQGGLEQLVSKNHRRDMKLLELLKAYDHSDSNDLATVHAIWAHAAETQRETLDSSTRQYHQIPDIRSIAVPWSPPPEFDPTSIVDPNFDIYDQADCTEGEGEAFQDEADSSGGEDEDDSGPETDPARQYGFFTYASGVPVFYALPAQGTAPGVSQLASGGALQAVPQTVAHKGPQDGGHGALVPLGSETDIKDSGVATQNVLGTARHSLRRPILPESAGYTFYSMLLLNKGEDQEGSTIVRDRTNFPFTRAVAQKSGAPWKVPEFKMQINISPRPPEIFDRHLGVTEQL
ncbi:hypothetical protein BJ508DRAFT_306034 [Ascobolus immersus RN42]|uniref:Uncharacterized protein n=1 Tax=Ascobolus immersus RN42 TaxID=1160509 RepID=A0A3N4I7U1_ASCIM|nr:hypothetical protein BJ508DRAFT_306034 [Ascobolus immersus RN42]